MPRSAASSSVPGLVTVTHSGGCGSCTGFGSTLRSGIVNASPSYSKGSSAHRRGRTRTYSSQCFLVRSGSASNPPSSVHVPDRAVPTSSRPPERMSSAAQRSATRIGWFISGTQTTAPCPTRTSRGLRGDRREHHLGRRAVRVLLEEVVLDAPDGVEPELVGKARLLERVQVDLLLDARCERPRNRQLEEDPELHARCLVALELRRPLRHERRETLGRVARRGHAR